MFLLTLTLRLHLWLNLEFLDVVTVSQRGVMGKLCCVWPFEMGSRGPDSSPHTCTGGTWPFPSCLCYTLLFISQGLPGPPGEKGEVGDVGSMV